MKNASTTYNLKISGVKSFYPWVFDISVCRRCKTTYLVILLSWHAYEELGYKTPLGHLQPAYHLLLCQTDKKVQK